MGLGNKAAGQGQGSLSNKAGGASRNGVKPLSALMGKATMGVQRKPHIPLGKTRLRITDTERAQNSSSLVVTFEIECAPEEIKDKVGTTCVRVFKFGGDEAKKQDEMRTADWCRFVVKTAGVSDLEALEAAGFDPFDLLDKSCLHESEEGAKPLVGERIEVETVDTGKVTAPSRDGKYKGGDPIHNNYWEAVGTFYEVSEEEAA